MLDIVMEINVLDEEEEDLTAFSDTGTLSGNMIYECHPELSATGVCPECAQYWNMEYDPNTGLSADGSVRVPEPGSVHANCVCIGVPVELAIAMGTKPQAHFEKIKSIIQKDKNADVLSNFGKKNAELINEGIINPEDVYKTDPVTKLSYQENLEYVKKQIIENNTKQEIVNKLKQMYNQAPSKRLTKQQLIDLIIKRRKAK